MVGQAEKQAVNNRDVFFQVIAITGFVTGILVGIVVIDVPPAVMEKRQVPVFAEEIKRRRGQST
jgi:hypothetical protein